MIGSAACGGGGSAAAGWATGRRASVVATLALALVLGLGEAIGLALREHLGLPGLAWLSVVSVAAYAIAVLLLAAVSPRRTVAGGLAQALFVLGVMAQSSIMLRRIHDEAPAGRVAAEVAGRVAASAALAALAARVLSQLPAPRAPRRVPALMAGAAALAIPSGLLLVGLEARRQTTAQGLSEVRRDGVDGPPPGGVPAGLRSVVVLVLDTTRADRLGAYGQARDVTPHLDRLSRQGLLFPESLSHASWTKPETAAILTSLHPTTHGAAREETALPDAAVTLAEALHAAGHLTVGFSANGTVSPAFGMHQGFDEFHQLQSWNPTLQTAYDLMPLQCAGSVLRLPLYLPGAFGSTADVVVDAVLDRVSSESRPLFLYVHFMDPHGPYFAPGGRGFARRVPNYRGTRGAAIEAYEGEIAFADGEIARLLASLRRHPVLRDAVIAVTSDHGEEFYDHGHISHGYTLYDEQLRVPLLLRLPGARAGGVPGGTARGIDVAPTLLAAASVPVPPAFQGRDLAGPPEPVAVFHEEDFGGVRLRALREGAYKLIVQEGRKGRRRLLFDLERDPAEQRNLVADHPARASELAERLHLVERALDATALSPDAPSAEAEGVLRGLGYIE